MSLQSLIIEGKPDRERFTVIADGIRLSLRLKSFNYLVTLAVRCLTDGAGWVYKGDLEPRDSGTAMRYVYRLRFELKEATGNDTIMIENNKLGYYRLQCDTAPVLAVEDIDAIPDHTVRELLRSPKKQEVR